MFVLFLLTVPIITMRLIAEERKLGTMEVLLTSPATEAQIVLAKFAASMSLIVLMLALSGAYAIVLGIYGNPDWGPIFSGYLGLVLLAAALVGFGLLTSALTDNQIIAALLSLSVFLLLWIIDEYGYLLPRSLRHAGREPVVVGAFPAVRDRIAVFFRCCVLSERGHALLVSQRSRAGVALTARG